MDGILTKSTNNTPEDHAWKKNNSIVIAWLYNVIDKTLYEFVTYAKKASEIWTNLKERYSHNNEIKIHQLKQKIGKEY